MTTKCSSRKLWQRLNSHHLNICSMLTRSSHSAESARLCIVWNARWAAPVVHTLFLYYTVLIYNIMYSIFPSNPVWELLYSIWKQSVLAYHAKLSALKCHSVPQEFVIVCMQQSNQFATTENKISYWARSNFSFFMRLNFSVTCKSYLFRPSLAVARHTLLYFFHFQYWKYSYHVLLFEGKQFSPKFWECSVA